MKKQDEKCLFWGIYKEEDWPAKTLDIMWMINQVGMLAGWVLFLNTCSGSRSIYDFCNPQKDNVWYFQDDKFDDVFPVIS